MMKYPRGLGSSEVPKNTVHTEGVAWTSCSLCAAHKMVRCIKQWGDNSHWDTLVRDTPRCGVSNHMIPQIIVYKQKIVRKVLQEKNQQWLLLTGTMNLVPNQLGPRKYQFPWVVRRRQGVAWP